MITSRGLVLISTADFIVRSAYQMGKTPLLPLYAASLGTGDILLGFIVSVSTLTGMVLKPLIGFLSDRKGRRIWLLVGTAFFAGMPFVYRLVGTPEHLLAVRVVHGLATAIYGPVTLAYVAELSRKRRAERLAWFSTARNAGYVVGPATAGWMLLYLDPVAVFTVIGILSSVAFLPVLLLPETWSPDSRRLRPPMRRALWSAARRPAIWLAGGVATENMVAVYAAKAFLPLYALSIGLSPALVGGFFAVQEATHIVLTPIGGRLSDRAGHLLTVGIGMATMGASLTLLTIAESGLALMAPAVLMGAAQALVSPSTTALVSVSAGERDLGLGMGLVGTLKNSGKVAGPLLAGALIYWLDFTSTFRLLGAALLVGATIMVTLSQLGSEDSRLDQALLGLSTGTPLTQKSSDHHPGEDVLSEDEALGAGPEPVERRS